MPPRPACGRRRRRSAGAAPVVVDPLDEREVPDVPGLAGLGPSSLLRLHERWPDSETPSSSRISLTERGAGGRPRGSSPLPPRTFFQRLFLRLVTPIRPSQLAVDLYRHAEPLVLGLRHLRGRRGPARRGTDRQAPFDLREPVPEGGGDPVPPQRAHVDPRLLEYPQARLAEVQVLVEGVSMKARLKTTVLAVTLPKFGLALRASASSGPVSPRAIRRASDHNRVTGG